jgi:hypothetical protein
MESAVFTPDNVEGVHWVRCGIIYNQAGDVDECMNTGSYYDNDDVNFTVTGIIATPSINMTNNKQNIISNYINYTSISGESYLTWNTTNLSYGNYSIISVARKANFLDEANYIKLEVEPDITPPNVTLQLPIDAYIKGVGTVNFVFSAYDINLKNCTLYHNIGGSFSANTTNISVANNINTTFANQYAPQGLYTWNVLCFDIYGNSAFAWTNFTLNITGPDFTTSTTNIWFGNETLVESSNLTIYANVTNSGLSPSTQSVIAQFFKNDPDLGGVQIGNNLTIGILDIGETTTINVSYILSSGTNNIFLKLDSDNVVNESNENNNKANNSILVSMYQYFYGNVTANVLLGSNLNSAVIKLRYDNVTSGNMFIAYSDSSFSFTDLQALGRNKVGDSTGNDFSDLDIMMNTTNFTDSINSVWANNTNIPLITAMINLSSKNISDVPIVQSVNNTDFYTGILWDTADDSSFNLQYDTTDKEDVVFVAEVGLPRQGAYGVYNYEIRIPASLRSYKGASNKVALYFELT